MDSILEQLCVSWIGFIIDADQRRFRQRNVICEAAALITLTHEILSQIGASSIATQGLPGYTFQRVPGESWRSRFDVPRNVIVVNNGHRDFVYASRSKSLKLRYLVRLYAKELVLHNFISLPADQLLERMVELSLRTEEQLRQLQISLVRDNDT